MVGSTPRNNPFRIQCTDALPFHLQDTTWEQLLARLQTLHYRGAIIGAKGRGKSTLLRDLGARLHLRDWQINQLRLGSSQRNFSSEQWRSFPLLSHRDLILLDGAEQLHPWRWSLFIRQTRRAGGIIVTTHRAGLLPTLYECDSSPQLLQELVAEIGAASENDLNLNESCAGVLLSSHDGNVREAFRELYDYYMSASPDARKNRDEKMMQPEYS